MLMRLLKAQVDSETRRKGKQNASDSHRQAATVAESKRDCNEGIKARRGREKIILRRSSRPKWLGKAGFTELGPSSQTRQTQQGPTATEKRNGRNYMADDSMEQKMQGITQKKRKTKRAVTGEEQSSKKHKVGRTAGAAVEERVQTKKKADAAPEQEQSKKHKKQKINSTVQTGEPMQPLGEGKQNLKKNLKKRKRRAAPKAEEPSLSVEEKLRRQKQRQLREMALQLRAEGKAYKRPAKRLATDKEKAKVAKTLKRKPTLQQPEETGTRPEHPVEVIVVPIYWNRKPEEKGGVIKAAEAVIKMLEAAGVQTGMDTTNAMSPGQKFAYWESKGVMVRIECGPREASRGECVLAISKKTGEVAAKQPFKVAPELLSAIGAALDKVLLPDQTAGRGGDAIMMESEGPGLAVKRTVQGSGDDMGDDFGDLSVDGDTNRKMKSKKKRF